MDETGPDGLLRHSVPAHWILRVFLTSCGTFILVMVIRELRQGVWPINAFSPFFGIILGGGCLVGGAMVTFGLFGPELRWTIGRGRIEILATNPFWRHTYRYGPSEIAAFSIRELDDSDGPPVWCVRMTTTGGKAFETRNFGSRQMAETVKTRFETAFYG